MNVLSKATATERRLRVVSAKRGLTSQLIILFTGLTLVLTGVVIVAWEQLLRPPYYNWVAQNYPGSENAENRYKIEQRGEHFFISMTVDVIVVSILLALVDRKQRKLVEAHDRLAHNEKVATLGRVAAQVAHEVRNPLAGLLLYSLHLKSKVAGRFPEDEIQVIDKIIETINHLTSTTEQILNFARPVRLSRHWVNLNGVAENVIHLLGSQITANGIDAKLELCDSEVAGMFDEASIQAAALNLILNAVQAMPSGGRLTISTGSDSEMIRMVISDTGSGMSAEEVKHIFEPFNTTKSRGLGLGMPYAQKIIEEHGGRIMVKSQPGEGTRVRIELPASRGENQ